MTRLPALGPRGEGWFGLQVLLALAIIASANWGGDWSGAAMFATFVAGALLVVAGVVLATVGSVQLGRSISPLPFPRDGGALVATGIYSRIRHPIYAGVIAWAIGWPLMVASLEGLALAALLAAVLDLKARREEAWLRERYAGYALYAGRTRRFVPGVY